MYRARPGPLNLRQHNSASIPFVLAAVALFAVTSLIAKWAGGTASETPLHPLQIASGRFCFGFLAALLFSIGRPKLSAPIPWKRHVQRSVCGWLGVAFLFAAAIEIPLSDANAISFLSVVVTLFLSIVLLGERVGIRRWSAALLALAGALVLVRPGTSAFQPAAMLALAAAVFIGIETVLIKILSGADSARRILLVNNGIGALVSLLPLPWVWTTPSPSQWLAMAAIGFIMVLAQLCNILAMRRGDASFVAPFWYAAPVFAALYDYLVFGQLLGAYSVIGIAMIAAGGIVISTRSGNTGSGGAGPVSR